MTAAVAPAPEKPKGFTRHDWRTVRLSMRKVAAELSHRGALSRCGTPLCEYEATFMLGDSLLDLGHHVSLGDVTVERFGRRARYRGVRECRNLWECPVCAERAARDAGEELRVAADTNRQRGGHNYTLTLTVKHSRAEVLEPMLLGLVLSWRKTVAGNPWKRQCDRYGIVGYVRAPEVTHGENGWHPHLHVAVFASRKLTEGEQEQLRDWMIARWRRITGKVFGSVRNVPTVEHGVVFRPMHKTDYLAKFGLAGEIAKATVKRSKGTHRSPWDLLQGITVGNAEPGDRSLWREYADALHGHKQLTWSKNLRALLDVEAGVLERRRAEAADDGKQLEREVVLTIPGRVYVTAVWQQEAEWFCLRAAESGRPASVVGKWFRRYVRRWYRTRGLAVPDL